MTKKKAAIKKPATKAIKQAKAIKRATVKRNKAFDALPPAGKRVAIAQDVLNQIKSKKLIPAHLTWVQTLSPTESDWRDKFVVFLKKPKKISEELQKVLASTPQCHTCALGALFTCAVKRADDLKLSELKSPKGLYTSDERKAGTVKIGSVEINEFDVFRYLKRFFTKTQLALMEYAFEGDNAASAEDNIEYGAARVALDHHYQEMAADARLIAIMENVIKNKGRFVVPKQQED